MLQQVLSHVDLVLFDIKHTDPQMHQTHTSVDNRRILENLRNIDRMGVPIWIRIPVIPGYNDSDQNIDQLANIVGELGSVERITGLPFNSAAGARYGTVGQQFGLDGTARSSSRELAMVASLSETGLPVQLMS